MKTPLLILSLLFLSHSTFAQRSNTSPGGDTAQFKVSQQNQNASSQHFDKLMIAPPQKLYLPLHSQSLPLTLYIPTYGNSNHLSLGQNMEDRQILSDFYSNYDVSYVRMPKPGTSDKVFSFIGISASAFVWGMVIKQAIDGKPNPNAPPQKTSKISK